MFILIELPSQYGGAPYHLKRVPLRIRLSVEGEKSWPYYLHRKYTVLLKLPEFNVKNLHLKGFHTIKY